MVEQKKNLHKLLLLLLVNKSLKFKHNKMKKGAGKDAQPRKAYGEYNFSNATRQTRERERERVQTIEVDCNKSSSR